MTATEKRELGMGRGKIYPAKHAGQLRNPLRKLHQSPARLVGSLELAEDAHVLELGCGPGYFSPTIASAVRRGRLELFDFQRLMLQMARQHLREQRVANFGCAQGDGMALPYRDGSFDFVLLVTVLGEVPDGQACLREAWRVLRPGGRLGISETRGDSDFSPLRVVRPLAEEAGFQFLARHGLAWNYTAVFRKPGQAG